MGANKSFKNESISNADMLFGALHNDVQLHIDNSGPWITYFHTKKGRRRSICRFYATFEYQYLSERRPLGMKWGRQVHSMVQKVNSKPDRIENLDPTDVHGRSVNTALYFPPLLFKWSKPNEYLLNTLTARPARRGAGRRVNQGDGARFN